MDDILLDLDGTISDPKDGILRSINYALTGLGFDERPEADLVRFIGPPLDLTFNALIPECSKELMTDLVVKYRERYFDVGWGENQLYEGIEQVLQSLTQQGYSVSVCTSKRTDIAQRIIDHFNLTHYFRRVFGGEVGISKAEQISDLIAHDQCNETSWMIGDRSFDIVAAKSNKMRSIGVLWGYGPKLELTSHKPDLIIEEPAELLSIEYKNLSNAS